LSKASYRTGTGLAYVHQNELLIIVDGYEGAVVDLE
jgi:hypothetical protein